MVRAKRRPFKSSSVLLQIPRQGHDGVQPEFDRRNAELIAKQTGTRVVDINPLSYDWEAEMMHTAKALAEK